VRPRRRRVLVAFLEAVALYALLGWIYVALSAAFRPDGLAEAVAHWLPLRKDTFGLICFVASAGAYFLLDLLGARPAWRRRSPAGTREDGR
jgi:hypothetical protein